MYTIKMLNRLIPEKKEIITTQISHDFHSIQVEASFTPIIFLWLDNTPIVAG